MDSLTIRHATPTDYDNVVVLLKQLNPDDPVIERTSGMNIFRTIMETAGLTIYVAEDGDQCVATCYLNIIPNLTRRGQAYAVVENVITSKAYQRKGFGVALLNHVIAEAFDAGCYKVMLMTGRDDHVHTFYEKCGMEKNSKTAFVIRK